ncbi:MAG: hypothetical protein ACLUJR_11720 [Mediterraneibacter gnavus]
MGSSVAQRDNVLTGLKQLRAGENLVSEVLQGSVTTANVTAGLLNNTLGTGNFLDLLCMA